MGNKFKSDNKLVEKINHNNHTQFLKLSDALVKEASEKGMDYNHSDVQQLFNKLNIEWKNYSRKMITKYPTHFTKDKRTSMITAFQTFYNQLAGNAAG